MRLKVVQVIPAFTIGGAEWMASMLASNLPRDRFEPYVISLYEAKGSPMESLLNQACVPIIYLNKRPGFDGRVYFRLAMVLRALKPDLVHTHQTVGRYVYPVCWSLRVSPIVHTIHSVAHKELRSAFWRRFQMLAYRYGRVHPVAIAEEVSQTFKAVYGRTPLAQIPNGIPVERFCLSAQDRVHWRAENTISPESCVFVCVAGLRPEKNHSLLIDSFARVVASCPQALLLLVGAPDREHPELAHAIGRQVEQSGLGNYVRFLGARSDIPEILNASDVFVLSSCYEGNPLSVMEAMAAGLPVVATAVGGVPELVEDTQSGILVPPGDASALTEVMLRLCNDPCLRLSMGEHARRTARERFDVSAMAKAYEKLYTDLISYRLSRNSS